MSRISKSQDVNAALLRKICGGGEGKERGGFGLIVGPIHCQNKYCSDKYRSAGFNITPVSCKLSARNHVPLTNTMPNTGWCMKTKAMRMGGIRALPFIY